MPPGPAPKKNPGPGAARGFPNTPHGLSRLGAGALSMSWDLHWFPLDFAPCTSVFAEFVLCPSTEINISRE